MSTASGPPFRLIRGSSWSLSSPGNQHRRTELLPRSPRPDLHLRAVSRRSVAPVITAIHTLVYAENAEQARNFLRDVLGWPFVDGGGGWLIFKTGPSELGVHPIDDREGQHHQIALMCDDVEATVAELRA
jgi:hypothetical protein